MLFSEGLLPCRHQPFRCLPRFHWTHFFPASQKTRLPISCRWPHLLQGLRSVEHFCKTNIWFNWWMMICIFKHIFQVGRIQLWAWVFLGLGLLYLCCSTGDGFKNWVLFFSPRNSTLLKCKLAQWKKKQAWPLWDVVCHAVCHLQRLGTENCFIFWASHGEVVKCPVLGIWTSVESLSSICWRLYIYSLFVGWCEQIGHLPPTCINLCWRNIAHF